MHAEALTRAMRGRWQGRYGTARCPAHEDRRPSLSIADGDDGRLLLYCHGGCSFDDIRRAIGDRVGRIGGEPAPPVSRPTSDACLSRLVTHLWQQSRAIGGSHGEANLRQRGIGGVLPESPRFHAALRHPMGRRFPAIVARVDDNARRLAGLHQTYLDPHRAAKANVEPAKAMLGRCRGHAVHLRPGHAGLAVAEGIETAMSDGPGPDDTMAIWAALSTSGMSGLQLPDPADFAAMLLIATDGDRAGRAAGLALAELRIETGLSIYFCDPRRPWQRGSNENTNGLLRQYFPKGTDLAAHGANDLAAVAHALNTRPRKTLGWRTLAEALDEILGFAQNDRVARTN